MVAHKEDHFPDTKLRDYVWTELKTRNITQKTVGEAVYQIQHSYYPDWTPEDFGKELPHVLRKREVLNPLAVGFALDNLATENKLPDALQYIVEKDAGQFGVDETVALSLVSLYGPIAVSNWGALDKNKIGVAKELDNKHGTVNTFADDLFSALVASIAGRVGQRVETNPKEIK